jgi:hypothetical protein
VLVERVKSAVRPVAEVTLVAGTVPGRVSRNVLDFKVGIGK